MAIRALLIGNSQMLARSCRALTVPNSDVSVSGTAFSAVEALNMVDAQRPDVVIVGPAVADMTGVAATRRIHASYPSVGILELSLTGDRPTVSRMIDAGACGYVLAFCDDDELLEAVRTVASGRTYLSPEMTGDAAGRPDRPVHPHASMLPGLTANQRHVLRCLARGMDTKQIAEDLQATGRAVEEHRRQIMERLGIASLDGLKDYASREDLSERE